jgi:hypothetical protein
MPPVMTYILNNKEWLFSGIGVFALSVMFALIRRIFSRRAAQTHNGHLGILSGGECRDPEPRHSSRATKDDGAPEAIPKEWQAIMPPQSKYVFRSERRSDVPLGLQSFSFEYGPEGQAKPLILKNVTVRAEIDFTCRVDNPYKALFGANDYALNVLPPRFLVQARNTLEAYSLSNLRENRLEASRAIVAAMASQFQELGVRLESVTIGALERVMASYRPQNMMSYGHLGKKASVVMKEIEASIDLYNLSHSANAAKGPRAIEKGKEGLNQEKLPAPPVASEKSYGHDDNQGYGGEFEKLNTPRTSDSLPQETIWVQMWSWVVVGAIDLFVLGGGIAFMTTGHAWAADAFFGGGTALFLVKFWTWEEAKRQPSPRKWVLQATVTLGRVHTKPSFCGKMVIDGNHS